MNQQISQQGTPQPGTPQQGTPQPGIAPMTALADDSAPWQRLHPLTPLMRGGLVLLVVGGVILANLRERIVVWFAAQVVPDAPDYEWSADPVDWVLGNNLVLLAGLAVIVVVAVLVGGFWLSWRFHTFRIDGDGVQVRRGIIFRSHRQAPLDRIQGVDLTRPFPARIFGLAKLQVSGAGSNANVPLEYLSTARAQEVREQILFLASGAKATEQLRAPGLAESGPEQSQVSGGGQGLRAQVTAGLGELIDGADRDYEDPTRIIQVSISRLLISQLLSVLLAIAIIVVAAGVVTLVVLLSGVSPLVFWAEFILSIVMVIPVVLILLAVGVTQVLGQARFTLAPSKDGVRATYGLLTTVSKTFPPGRIHAVAISQPLVWRPFGWWSIRVNLMRGTQSSSSSSSDKSQVLLPVGTRADVQRVLALIVPDLPAADLDLVLGQGLEGSSRDPGDPFLKMAHRARWRRPISWRRDGVALTADTAVFRAGSIWRTVAVFPLARVQGISVRQGPVDRLQQVGTMRVHSISGPARGRVVGFEAARLLALWEQVLSATVGAATRDRTHRWAQAPEAAPVANQADSDVLTPAPGYDRQEVTDAG